MNFHGIQKLTLIDYPQKAAATLFTGGCNYRCPFCHNASLVVELDNQNLISEEEILAFLKKRIGILDGVCITGGEPLMHPGISAFAQKVKELGYSIKLDTNGSYPDRLFELVNNKLVDYVAMDIKNSLPEYGKTIGLEGYDTQDIERSADFLLSGIIDCEFRTTVVRELHSKESFELIGKRFKGAKSYYLQAFTDSGNIIGSGLSAYEKPQMQEFADILSKYMERVILREI